MIKYMLKKENFILMLTFLFSFYLGFNVSFLEYKNFNNQDLTINELENVAISTIIVNESNNNVISSKDLMIEEEILKTYEAIINSHVIKNAIKKQYSNIDNVKLEVEENNMINVIYSCGKTDEKTCIEINNLYTTLFKEALPTIYNIDKISILQKADKIVKRIKVKALN